MKIDLAKYLGCAAIELLGVEPFVQWAVVRSVETDPRPEASYIFEGRGVAMTCDGMERIKSLFLRSGDGERLIGISFATSRNQIWDRFGLPQKSGDASRIPGIGERGPWDRFELAQGLIHFQYAIERDEIDMITLMRRDIAP